MTRFQALRTQLAALNLVAYPEGDASGNEAFGLHSGGSALGCAASLRRRVAPDQNRLRSTCWPVECDVWLVGGDENLLPAQDCSPTDDRPLPRNYSG